MTTTQTTRMYAPTGVGGVIQAPNGTYFVASDGSVTVNAADVRYLTDLGFVFSTTEHRVFTFPGAPVASSATVTVTSTSLTAGSLTIAAQPDVCRQLQVRTDPGTTAITAGSLVMTYTANDGTTQVDTLSLITAASTTATLTTTKGVEVLSSAVISGVTGGTTPGIQIGTNNYLGVPVPPRFSNFTVTSEKKITPTAGTLGLTVPSNDTVPTALVTTGALILPTTAPNGTIGLSFGYNFTFP